jgi:hypothetical protein
MGITSGTATYTRFYIPPVVADSARLMEFVSDRLNRRAFKAGSPEAVTMGFVSYDDPSSAAFNIGSDPNSEWITVAMRLDERLFSPLTLRLELSEQLMQYRRENAKRPSKEERKAMALSIREQLVKGAPAQPRHHGIVWCPAARLLLFESTNRVLLRRFSHLFSTTFGCVPVPLYHVQWADKRVALEPHIRGSLREQIDVDSPTAYELGRNLGYGFLAWLFVNAEQGLLDSYAGERISVRTGDSIALCKPGSGKERISCTDAALIAYQVRMSMKFSYAIQKLRLVLQDTEEPETCYGLGLDTSLAAIEGLSLPRLKLSAGDPERIKIRMAQIERVHRILDHIYARYLSLRLGGTWPAELERIKAWLAAGM